MRTALTVCAAVLVGAAAAEAQTTERRFYLAATTGTEHGTRGPISRGAVPSAGVLFGGRVFITDDPYTVFRLGVRAIWSF